MYFRSISPSRKKTALNLLIWQFWLPESRFSYGIVHILQFRHEKLDYRVAMVSTINRYCLTSRIFEEEWSRRCLQPKIQSTKQWHVAFISHSWIFWTRKFRPLTNPSRKWVSSSKTILFEESSLFLKSIFNNLEPVTLSFFQHFTARMAVKFESNIRRNV